MGCCFVKTEMDRRGTNLIADLSLLYSYYKIVREICPDVVMTYNIKPTVYGGLICRIMKKAYLPTITGLGTAVRGKELLRKIIVGLYRIGLKNAQCVFFQNKSDRQFFIDCRIPHSRSRVIPGSGVNLEEYCVEEYPDAKDVVRLLFIGRIMKAKGIDELILAAKRIKNSYANIEFHLVGFCEEDYHEQLGKLHDAGIVFYHGYQNNMRQFIKNAHAVLLPSHHEGISNVLLEAASTGRPVLASDVPGCRETFDEGISGLGFEAKNVEALVSVIKKFCELSYDEKKAMGLAGRKKMEREYDRQIVINAYMDQLAVVKSC